MRRAAALMLVLGCGHIDDRQAARPGDSVNTQPSLRVVRAYEAWTDHDPSHSDRTQAGLSKYDAECGLQTGPFELLRLTTTRDEAASIVREIDRTGVPRMIEQAFARAAAVLPGPSLTVCVYAGELSRGLPYLGGVGGIAIGGGTVKLFIHPTKENFAKVPYTVAHEYHHEVQRAIAPFRGPDDVVIREGKADHFAVGLYPDLRPPHTNQLSDQELANVWPAFLEFREGGMAQADFMISARGPLPVWAGYRLAFEMVGHHLATTGRTAPGELLRVPSSAIIDGFSRSTRILRFPRRTARHIPLASAPHGGIMRRYVTSRRP